MNAGKTRPTVLTVPEVAEILRVPRQRAYELCRRNIIPCKRMGRLVRVPLDSLNAWLQDKPGGEIDASE